MNISNRFPVLVVVLVSAAWAGGCELNEVRLKSKGGVEYRRKNSDKSDAERYLVQEAIQCKWDNGVDTSVIYRRRDVSDSPSGDHDDGVWFEIGIPLWKAPKKADPKDVRIAALEYRLAKLEAALGAQHGEGEAVAAGPTPQATLKETFECPPVIRSLKR